jgi:hypothetical protein
VLRNGITSLPDQVSREFWSHLWKLLALDPLNRARRTSQCGKLGLKLKSFGVDDREGILHLDQALGGVSYTDTAPGAGHAAMLFGRLSGQQRATLYDQFVAEGYNREEILGADIDAISTGGAGHGVHNRQLGGRHDDRVEGADVFAVGKSQTSVSTALETASNG